MSGIFGYVGEAKAVPMVLKGLKFLDYRGYDSAGVATIDEGEINLRKVVGSVAQLRTHLDIYPIEGRIGLGHTRWATHGAPSQRNAHPLIYGDTCIVHNGIVENSKELEAEISEAGLTLETDTDSEVIVCLFDKLFKKEKDLLQTAIDVLEKIKGPYAFLIFNKNEPEKIIAATNGNPLSIGLGNGEFFVASDVTAFVNHAEDVVFMEDGDIALISKFGVQLYDSTGKGKEADIKKVQFSQTDVEKGGYRKYMLKEIFEQPRVIRNTINKYISGSDFAEEFDGLGDLFKGINKILILACGSTANSARIGKHILETYIKVPVNLDISSEYRYKTTTSDENTLVIAISQSGETADTLEAIKNCKKNGAKVLAITNTTENSLARLADFVFHMQAGPELSVCSTKTFTATLTALYILGAYLGSVENPEMNKEAILEEIINLPTIIEKVFTQEEQIEKVASLLSQDDSVFIVGRGINYAVTLEGALKLQEIAYLKAFGFAAGELKHGPIALIDDNFPIISLVPEGEYYDKMVIDVTEIKSRNCRSIVVTNKVTKALEKIADEIIEIPAINEFYSPIVTTIVLQLFAYSSGFIRKHDIDKPRNIAKSVTV